MRCEIVSKNFYRLNRDLIANAFSGIVAFDISFDAFSLY